LLHAPDVAIELFLATAGDLGETAAAPLNPLVNRSTTSAKRS
jgi:hypothetical protein